jgi:hypothetical protein
MGLHIDVWPLKYVMTLLCTLVFCRHNKIDANARVGGAMIWGSVKNYVYVVLIKFTAAAFKLKFRSQSP